MSAPVLDVREYPAVHVHAAQRAAAHPAPVWRRSAWRFGVVGLGGTFVNGVCLYLLHGGARWLVLPSLVVATELAVCSNFICNNSWAFGERAIRIARLARFHLASLGGMAIALGSTLALMACKVPCLPADLLGIAAGALCNYAASTRWIWRAAP